MKNLADDPKYAVQLADLRAECDAWLERTKDKGAIPVEQLIAQKVITERNDKYLERLKRGGDAVKEELKK